MPAKKSTARSNGKFGNFLSKLNPNSPKKKLLLFVIIFGVIAGGFYAYRSFAATTAVKITDLYNRGGAVTSYTNSKGAQIPIWAKSMYDNPKPGYFKLPDTIKEEGGHYCVWALVRKKAGGSTFVNGKYTYKVINPDKSQTQYPAKSFNFTQVNDTEAQGDNKVFCHKATPINKDSNAYISIELQHGYLEMTNLQIIPPQTTN